MASRHQFSLFESCLDWQHDQVHSILLPLFVASLTTVRPKFSFESSLMSVCVCVIHQTHHY